MDVFMEKFEVNKVDFFPNWIRWFVKHHGTTNGKPKEVEDAPSTI